MDLYILIIAIFLIISCERSCHKQQEKDSEWRRKKESHDWKFANDEKYREECFKKIREGNFYPY